MDSTTIINLALLLVTAVGVVAAIYAAVLSVGARNDAQDAQKESERARDEALRLSDEANTFFSRQAEAQEAQNRDRLHDRRRELVRDVIVELANMAGVASTAKSKSESRVAAVAFEMRVGALRLGMDPRTSRQFEYWAMNVHESYLGVDDGAYLPAGRVVHDFARPIIALAMQQLIQWERGDATAEEMLLEGEKARERFLPNYNIADYR